MTEKLFPLRQRCKACSKKLDKTVLDGLYCSYRCGGFAQPYTNISEAPKPCKFERDGVPAWKVRYRSVGEVPERLQKDPSSNIYTCPNCHFYHVGHLRKDPKEKSRLVSDEKILGDTLFKIREDKRLTRKQVADKIKTRPIRLKEIEEGDPKMDVSVLFKLLYFYRMKVSVTLPQ